MQASFRGAEADPPASQRAIDQLRVEFDQKSKALLLDYRMRVEEAETAKSRADDELSQQIEKSQDAISQLDSELVSLRDLIEEERTATLREFKFLSNELAAHRRNARRLRTQVNEVTSSTSWKIARALTAALHPLRSVSKLRDRFGSSKKKRAR